MKTSMLFMSVKVESYQSNSPAQCFACHRFGHFSLHCGYAPRCVKCTGPHLAKDCSKAKETDSKCTNCEGVQCPALLREKTIRQPNRPNTYTPLNTSTPDPALIATPTIVQQFDHSKPTYASIAATSSISTSTPDIKAISAQLVALIPLIESGKAKVKDAFLMVLSILPLLLNQS